MGSKEELSPTRRALLLVNLPQMTVATGIIINHFYLHAAAVGPLELEVERAVNGRHSHPRQRQKSSQYVTLPGHPATHRASQPSSSSSASE